MRAKKKTSPKLFCFVLMPFKREFDDIYDLGIKAACGETRAVYCERVDKQIFAERWLDRIFNQIAKADIVIADMSDLNPNVFYEVGYAHALGKPTILLSQTVDEIPSDLRAYSHVVYDKSITTLKGLLTPKIQWYVDNGVGGAAQSRAELEVYIDEKKLDSTKSAQENGTFQCSNGFRVTVKNISNHTLIATDYVLVFDTPSSLVRQSLRGEQTTPVFLTGDRFQYNLESLGTLFPGQADSEPIGFYRQSEDGTKLEMVVLRVYTANGSMEFPVMLLTEEPPQASVCT